MNNLAMSALAKLIKVNPRMGNVLDSCLKGGESPLLIMQQAIEAGTINYEQFKAFRRFVSQTNFNIPSSELDKFEQLFNNGNQGNDAFRF